MACGKRLTVLHDITDDPKLVKVSTASLGAEGLLEGDLNVGDEGLVEGGVEHDVGEAKNEKVLDHLLSKVVIDAEDLARVGRKVSDRRSRPELGREASQRTSSSFHSALSSSCIFLELARSLPKGFSTMILLMPPSE